MDESGPSKEISKPLMEDDDNENDDDNEGLTMLDVLADEQTREDDANAVLGGSDDKNCTYSRGYVQRQALYTCTTCLPSDAEDFKPTAICLACSYHCHEGHELVELYTKRNFKCDCGNEKFKGKTCNLEQNKDAENILNQYNQNFLGVYCTCKRPYPDPDDNTEDEMIQCILCEDWYHGRHLENPIPSMDNYSEMICGTCMEKNTFLWKYADCFVTGVDADSSMNASVDEGKAMEVKEDSANGGEKNGKSDAKENGSPKEMIDVTTDEKKEVAEKFVDPKLDDAKDGPSKSVTNEGGCLLKKKAEGESPKKSATFWASGWRKRLCVCDECKAMYEDLKLAFLPDEGDMVQAYEEAGKEKQAASGSQYEQGMLALSSIDRVRQIDAIEEYNKMKLELKEYLQKFADSKKVVREEDIKEFFEGLKARKKQKTESSVPHFCH